MIDFEKQNILVTGASSGIGKSIALCFASMGANVLATGSRNKCEFNYSNITYKKVNFLNKSEFKVFLEFITTKPFDVCVNNAGINRKNSFTNTRQKDWEDTLFLNTEAPMKIIKNIINNMIDQKHGRIVNISSLWSMIGAPNRLSYISSKHALNGITVSAASEFSKYNVLVNSVSPGFVLTDMTKNNLNKKQIDKIIASIPINRMCEPDEIAKVVMFLCSKSNSYISGQNLVVDGGMSTCCVYFDGVVDESI